MGVVLNVGLVLNITTCFQTYIRNQQVCTTGVSRRDGCGEKGGRLNERRRVDTPRKTMAIGVVET